MEELQKCNVQLMESCCDIIDQLPSEVYNYIFGDKVKDFVQLRSLRSRVKAKIVKVDKLLQNEAPQFVSTPRATPTPVPFVKNVSDMFDDGEECEDLIDFLKLNEEDRDSWGGATNDRVPSNFNGIFFLFKCLNCLLASIATFLQIHQLLQLAQTRTVTTKSQITKITPLL